MKQSDLNHLRRLLGWIRCDIGQAPGEMVQTMIDVAGKLGNPEISPEAQGRLMESYRRAEAVPIYVRDAVKALEKVVAATGRQGPAAAGAGRRPGAETARATAETRTSAGFDPGAAAGREPALDDIQIEDGLAEIGVHVWGQRAEDWLAGAEYAARLLRGHQQPLTAERCENEASAAAAPLQNHPNAAAYPVACRDTPAAPPTLRRDDAGGATSARRHTPTREAQEVQVNRATAGHLDICRPAATLQVIQEALRLVPSDEARRVAREAEAGSVAVTPAQYVGAGAVAVLTNAWLEKAANLCFDPQDAERIRALKDQAEKGDEKLPTCERPKGSPSAKGVVLPPLPETIAWATVNPSLATAVDELRRAAVLLDRQQSAATEPAMDACGAEITSYALLGGTRVERVAQPDGTYLWAVRRNGNCLGLDGHWSYEPLPSSRAPEWLAFHRFPTAQAAIDASRRQEGEAC